VDRGRDQVVRADLGVAAVKRFCGSPLSSRLTAERHQRVHFRQTEDGILPVMELLRGKTLGRSPGTTVFTVGARSRYDAVR
jgi:hypothetical protein